MHDVAQVAATASSGGASVVAVAMLVKLTRVLLLTPIVVGINLNRARQQRLAGKSLGTEGDAQTAPSVLPMFVAGFIAMVLLRTTGWLPADVIGGARQLEGLLFAAALIGLGSGVQVRRLRRLGPQPLLLGFVAWIVVAATSYVGIVVVL